MFTDSLTIRILGDSSGLDQELNTVSQRLSRLQSQFDAVNQAPARLGRSLAGLGTGGLDRVNSLLAQILQKMQQINATPLQINVAPALDSLATLGRALDGIAARMQSLALPGMGGGFLPFPVPTGGGRGGGGFPLPAPAGPIRGFATGGLVTGPAGTDRVPAWLTAGEYVLSEPAVRQLGPGRLDQLNHHPTRSTAPRPAPTDSPSLTTINQVGELSIHVQQPLDVDHVLRALDTADWRLRTRRG